MRTLWLLVSVLALSAGSLPAQGVLERSPDLPGGEVGLPWTVDLALSQRFADVDLEGVGLEGSPTFRLGLGLPRASLVQVSFAPSSPTGAPRDAAAGPGVTDEWELLARHRLLGQDGGWPADVALTAAYNTAAESVDGEVSLARWHGPVRLMAAVRGFLDPYVGDESRWAVGGGAVWHVLPGRIPVAVAGDAVTLVDREEGEDVAWSAGLQVGISYTSSTLSLQASNAATTTLEGSSAGIGPTRYGFELTLPVPAGFFLGTFVPREEAMEAVSEVEAGEGGPVTRVEIRRYAFGSGRVEIPVGGVVEWVNRDAVVHTATAENGAWDSHAIRTGESWRARFDRPGTYPYYCGPHPFMTGVVVVRP